MNDDSAHATKGDLKNLATKGYLEKFATKDDLKNFATKDDLRSSILRLENSMNEKFEKVHEDINLVLDVLINIDKRYQKKTDDHEERIIRIEKIVM